MIHPTKEVRGEGRFDIQPLDHVEDNTSLIDVLNKKGLGMACGCKQIQEQKTLLDRNLLV